MFYLFMFLWVITGICFLVGTLRMIVAKIKKQETKRLRTFTLSSLVISVVCLIIAIAINPLEYEPTAETEPEESTETVANVNTSKGELPLIEDGIYVEVGIASNIKEIDEGVIVAKITNQTDKTFSGHVDLIGGQAKYWRIDVENLPPGESIERQTKIGYIDTSTQQAVFSRYEVRGHLEDKSHTSAYDYTIIYKPDDATAFYVQTEEVTKQSAIEIIKDLYAKYGENLTHVSIYDKTQNVKEGDMPEESPKADYFKTGNIITIYENGKAESFTLDTN